MKRFTRFMALAALAALHVFGQDISGEWQGSLKAGPQELRVILQVRSDKGAWIATLLSIDQSPDRGVGMVATSFALDGFVNKRGRCCCLMRPVGWWNPGPNLGWCWPATEKCAASLKS